MPEARSRLDAAAGRAGPPVGPPLPPRSDRRFGRARRPFVAAVFVAGLAAAWLATGAVHHPGATPRPGDSPVPTAAPPARRDTSTLRAWFGDPRACRDLDDTVPAIACDVDGVSVHARLVGVAAVSRAQARAAATFGARRGPAACARGHEDERSWSRPSAPRRAVGRYRCAPEHGRAAMWWTDEHGVVVHAVAPDASAARLFAWWAAHLEG